MNSTSFESTAFTNTNRPIHLSLINNKIRYLDEKIFAPILRLDKRNVIDLAGNSLLCYDCRMKWLIRDKESFGENQIKVYYSENGKDVWQLWEIDFNNCE